MELSIVIPVYNETAKVAEDILTAGAFLTEHGIEGEVVIADDGSTDETVTVAQKTQSENPQHPVTVLRLAHRGKGHAVREGILASQGQYVLFADSGGCIPFKDALAGLEMIRQGRCQIAHGSRRLAESKIVRSWSPWRRLWSDAFQWFIRSLCGVGRELTDTQCGFKVYEGQAGRKLYRQCQTDGFMFDIEVILRAKRLKLPILEFPVQWKWDTDSRLHPVRKSIQMVHELVKIRRMLRTEKKR